MQDSIFTKIIKGEIPCHKIYEDQHTIAFLDIHPVQEGMTVVAPKIQIDNFEDLDEEYYTALWSTVHKVAKRMHAVYADAKKIAVQVEGLDVPHAHVKLFTANTASDLRKEADPDLEPDHPALAEVAQKLAF